MKRYNSRTIGRVFVAWAIGLIMGSAIAWSQMAKTTIKTVQALEATQSLTQRRKPRHGPSTPASPRRPGTTPPDGGEVTINNQYGERLPENVMEILERDGEYHYRAEGA